VIFSPIVIGLVGSIQRTPPSRLKDASTAVLPGFVSLAESMTGFLKHKGLPPPVLLQDLGKPELAEGVVLQVANTQVPEPPPFWQVTV